jgi:hypothetical protein
MSDTSREELVLLDEDSDPTVATMNKELVEEVVGVVANMVTSLFEIDLELEKCKKALSLLQPHAPGRLDMRFWSHKTIPGKHPQLIRWMLLRPGLQAPVRGVKQRRASKGHGHHPAKLSWTGLKLRHKAMTQWAKRSKGFQDTHEFVVEVLRAMQVLLDTRSVLLERLSTIRRDEARWGAARRSKVKTIGSYLDSRMPGWERVAGEVKKIRSEEAAQARRLIEEANASRDARKWGRRR